jgi:hypothetical protein
MIWGPCLEGTLDSCVTPGGGVGIWSAIAEWRHDYCVVGGVGAAAAGPPSFGVER